MSKNHTTTHRRSMEMWLMGIVLDLGDALRAAVVMMVTVTGGAIMRLFRVQRDHTEQINALKAAQTLQAESIRKTDERFDVLMEKVVHITVIQAKIAVKLGIDQCPMNGSVQ